jgi:SAM-dependent methyltransferase
MKKTNDFWNREYDDPKHLTMSTDPSGDLLEFITWTKRNAEWPAFPKHGMIVDIGCGNGRNIVPLCYEFNMNGLGTEISEVAINQAKAMVPTVIVGLEEEGVSINPGLKLEFKRQQAQDPLPLADQSADVVFDMMVSHQLVRAERERLAAECARVLKPYGWLFFKTFLLEGDMNAKRMIEEYGINKDMVKKDPKLGGAVGEPEPNSYVHPQTHGFEHVYTEDEVDEVFGKYFKIHKIKKSHKHIKDGKPWKRRTMSVYMERLRD